MFITKHALPRRTVLRGLGATLALPLLDAMVPALSALTKTAANPARRFGAVYVPNGMTMEAWTPAAEGTSFEFTPILKPLEPFRDRLLVISGLNGPRGHDHAGASTGFLTGMEDGGGREGGDAQRGLMAGISIDQLAALEFGHHTQLASLELAMDGADGTTGGTYSNTISWRTPTMALPMENNPRTVFEQLFGDNGTTDAKTRGARRKRDKSILDSVSQAVASLEREVGPRDRVKIREYLEGVRDIERRIQNAEAQRARELPVVTQPAGIPSTFEEHAGLMFDLQLLAYQCDLTRVITFMLGREHSGMTYPQIGVPDAHHPISHHQGEPEKIAKVAKINEYHMQMFAKYLEKLQAARDGDGTLLDSMTLMYGAGIADSNSHAPTNIPMILAGGGAGHLKGGRHINFKAVPLANLHLTLMDQFGVRLDKMGDSTGRIDDKILSL